MATTRWFEKSFESQTNVRSITSATLAHRCGPVSGAGAGAGVDAFAKSPRGDAHNAKSCRRQHVTVPRREFRAGVTVSLEGRYLSARRSRYSDWTVSRRPRRSRQRPARPVQRLSTSSQVGRCVFPTIASIHIIICDQHRTHSYSSYPSIHGPSRALRVLQIAGTSSCHTLEAVPLR